MFPFLFLLFGQKKNENIARLSVSEFFFFSGKKVPE